VDFLPICVSSLSWYKAELFRFGGQRSRVRVVLAGGGMQSSGGRVSIALQCSDDGFWPGLRRSLRASVVSGRSARLPVSLPLGSTGTAVGEASSEVVADDVARLVARVLVVADVLVAAEVCYKHITTQVPVSATSRQTSAVHLKLPRSPDHNLDHNLDLLSRTSAHRLLQP